VKVESRGGSYFVGDTRARESKRIFVEPVTESHVNVQYSLSGQSKTETVLGYAETGYCGNVTATFRADRTWAIEDDVDNNPCWKGWFEF